MRRRAPRIDPAPEPSELDGFLAGVSARIDARADPERAELRARFDPIAARLRAHHDRAALAALMALDDELVEEEPALSQLPRGLVAYQPRGPVGGPVPDEEDPVANRLRLLGRIASVLEREGRPVGPVRERLARAEVSFANGDRTAARRLGEDAQVDLERLAERPPEG